MKTLLLSPLTALMFLFSSVFADELIIFHMPGCRPCAQLKQMLKENPELLQGFSVSTIDIIENPETARVFSVSSVPTVVRLNDKTREVGRKVGSMSKREMQEWLKKTDGN